MSRLLPYNSSELNLLRQANLVSLMSCGIDLVQLFDRSIRTNCVGPLPWNQVFSILAATTVDFYHPASPHTVNSFHQLTTSDEPTWEQGSWSTLAEVCVMTGFCRVKHPDASYLNPSHYDIKIGALNILRLVESILDICDLNDDLVNYGTMILSDHNQRRRLFQLYELAENRGVKISLDANIKSGVTVSNHYRWLSPHCYRLRDFHGGDLRISSFKMDKRLGVWSGGRLTSPNPKVTAEQGLSTLRLRISDSVESKDLRNTIDGSQTRQDKAQILRYDLFQNRFLNRAVFQQLLAIPPLSRICNYTANNINVVAFEPNLN